MGRRTLLLLASILVAAAGTALIWVYVQSADERAQAAWNSTVLVFRAAKAIDTGAQADVVRASVERVPVPTSLVPAQAVTDLAAVSGRAPTMPIAAGQLLVSSQFDPLPSTVGVAKDKAAVSVSVEDPNRVAGLLHPNMTVDVYYVDVNSTRAKQVDGSARLLLPSVRVLAVGNTSVLRNAQGRAAQVGTQSGVAAAIVTLEVTPADAPKIIIANARGSLWFTVPGQAVTHPANDGYTGGQLPAGRT
jgi:pilus assembly protein CpaB